MRPNLLDFTPSGQAIIDLPNYNEISFLEEFGFSPIENVEQEILQADSPERAAFLQHYVNTYKNTFTEPPKNYTEESEYFEIELPDFKALNDKSIHLRNVHLLHTTAWYMMGHVDAEIRAIMQHLDKFKYWQMVRDNLEEFINIIRISENPEEATERIQKHFKINHVVAQYFLNLPLAKLTSFDTAQITAKEEDYKQRLAFVCTLELTTQE